MELFKDEKASSLKLLKLLLRNFRLILIFTVIGALVGVAITFFIPKKFMAYSVVFPPNSNLGLNILEDPRFGNSLDADQLMQLLESRQVMDSVVKIYNLESYYDIDNSKKGWREKLDKFYYRDITFNKTRYYSVVITAKLKDPELAANVVNSIVDIVDYFRHKIIRGNQLAAYEYARTQFDLQNAMVDELKGKIYSMKHSEDPDDLLYNHLIDISKMNSITSKPFVINPELEALVEAYIYESEKLKNLKSDFHKAQRLIEKPLSKVFIVNRAKPKYKKVSPSYLLNGIIGFSSSLLFIIFFLVLRDRYSTLIKELRKE